ncbi:MAG: DNA alkylation repair protein [Clostridia bacterium]|nr:DNA alkylation repair protein [Clostridia bacterium]
MKYDKELNEKITFYIDEEYSRFHAKLIPGVKIRGVKIPNLRKIAKDFCKYLDFLDNITLNNYEAICVACYYIGLTTKDEFLLKSRLDFILPLIDNWATCDTFVGTLKIFKQKNEKLLPIILDYLNSGSIFTKRFAIVCLLTYYIKDKTINDLFCKISKLQGEDYYIDMAIAWFVSVAFVKCREQTLKLLKSNALNSNVQSKSISKICDSYRVSKEDKVLVKTLKK